MKTWAGLKGVRLPVRVLGYIPQMGDSPPQAAHTLDFFIETVSALRLPRARRGGMQEAESVNRASRPAAAHQEIHGCITPRLE